MSYLVLARKWRPRTFEELVGQEHVRRALTNALDSGRIHHAFLFCGPRGVGKTTGARILAKALCCETGPTATPCNVCGPCTEITAGRATDFIEIDGASNRGIDNIRELRESVRYQPARLRRKVYVIDEVHMLTTEAFNALLKTLEEPPPHVTFVLATTEPHKLPVTILSRCQRYDFKLVPLSKVAEALGRILAAEKIEVEAAALTLLARESGGSMRDSLSLTDQMIAYSGGKPITAASVAEVLGVADRALLAGLARALVTRELETALRAVDAAEARGVDVAQLAKALLGHVRDLALVSEVKDATGLVDGGEIEVAELKRDAQGAPAGLLPMLFERLARACVDLTESPLPRATLELALVDCVHAVPLEPIGDLIERLEKIERGGGGGGGGAGGGSPRPVQKAPAAAPAQAPGPASAKPSTSPSTSTSPSPSPSTSTSPSPSTSPSAPAPRVAPVAPAPAAPAPAAPAAAPPASNAAAWQRIVDLVEVKRPMLASNLTLAQAEIDGRKLIIGIPEDANAALEHLNEPHHLQLVKNCAKEVLGHEVDLTTRSLRGLPVNGHKADAGAAPASLRAREMEAQRVDRAAREAEARQHPLVKAALDVFSTNVELIKTDDVD